MWMRELLLIIAGALACSCGSSPSSPTPAEPSLLGGWVGTLALMLMPVGSSSSSAVRCGLEWSVTTQIGGVFSGTWALSRPAGVAPPLCEANTGSLSGRVSSNGAVTDIRFERLLDLNPLCSSPVRVRAAERDGYCHLAQR